MMTTRILVTLSLATAILAYARDTAQSAIILEFTAGTNDTATGGTGFFGQSLTTPGGGPWDSLSFNFFADDGSTPVAFGDLFLLDQEYLGTPAALSSGTPGFLAQSTGISSNIYQFDPSVTLNSLTQYFLYNGGTQGGDIGFQVPGTLAGGTAYINDGIGGTYQPTPNTFNPDPADVNFRLQGTVASAAVPEPSSLAMMTIAGLAAITTRRLRRRRTTAASS